MTGCGIMSSVWDMILQGGSTIKVSIELPVANRHRRDMTEKLLNSNTHTHFMFSILYLVKNIQESILSWLNFDLALWPK